MSLRTALYARFSDDVQNPRSIADQLALGRARAAERGRVVAGEYADAGISGAAMANRPGFLQLIADAEAGRFERVLVESLDRSARDLEHLAHMYNRLTAVGVALDTLAKDDVSLMEIAFGGLMGQKFLIDLAAKTRRGMHANAEAGLATGARTYGYATRKGGHIEIVPAEADVVAEVFARYAKGDDTRRIAASLNARAIPGPFGRQWNPSTLNGSRQRGNGILNCELYVGTKVWNRFLMAKDRATGKRTSTPRPAAEWKRTPVPHLRIVPDEHWAAVQARKTIQLGQTPYQRRRVPRGGLFSGLIKCAQCGATMTAYNATGRLICAARRERGPAACGNADTVARQQVEQRVLDGLATQVLTPEAVQAYVRTYRAAWAAKAARSATEAAPLTKRLATIDASLTRLADAIADTGGSATLITKLQTLEAERATVAAQLATSQASAESAPVPLHPGLPDRYRRRIAALRQNLAAHAVRAQSGDEAALDTVTKVRALVGRIEVRALPFGLTEGEPPVMIRANTTLAPLLEGEIPRVGRYPHLRLSGVVAGDGLEPSTCGL